MCNSRRVSGPDVDELQLAVRASETLRRYGFCEADPWDWRDSSRAAQLLPQLRLRREELRASLNNTGVPTAKP